MGTTHRGAEDTEERRMLCRLLMLVAAGSLVVSAQAPTSPALAFEVASIRPVQQPLSGRGGGLIPGRFFTSNATLLALVQTAYDVPGYRVFNNGASWVGSEEFAVDARAANIDGKTATREQVKRMLQALLAERFKLTLRRETRDMPVYRLAFARTDRRLGAQLRPSRSDCSTPEAASRTQAAAKKDRIPCFTTMGPAPGGLRSYTADGIEFTRLTGLAAETLGRHVTNETGLSGLFDWELIWADRPEVEGPALPIAFQEQLGLRLEPGRGLVEILVIETAERPTPN